MKGGGLFGLILFIVLGGGGGGGGGGLAGRGGGDFAECIAVDALVYCHEELICVYCSRFSFRQRLLP